MESFSNRPKSAPFRVMSPPQHRPASAIGLRHTYESINDDVAGRLRPMSSCSFRRGDLVVGREAANVINPEPSFPADHWFDPNPVAENVVPEKSIYTEAEMEVAWTERYGMDRFSTIGPPLTKERKRREVYEYGSILAGVNTPLSEVSMAVAPWGAVEGKIDTKHLSSPPKQRKDSTSPLTLPKGRHGIGLRSHHIPRRYKLPPQRPKMPTPLVPPPEEASEASESIFCPLSPGRHRQKRVSVFFRHAGQIRRAAVQAELDGYHVDLKTLQKTFLELFAPKYWDTRFDPVIYYVGEELEGEVRRLEQGEVLSQETILLGVRGRPKRRISYERVGRQKFSAAELDKQAKEMNALLQREQEASKKLWNDFCYSKRLRAIQRIGCDILQRNQRKAGEATREERMHKIRQSKDERAHRIHKAITKAQMLEEWRRSHKGLGRIGLRDLRTRTKFFFAIVTIANRLIVWQEALHRFRDHLVQLERRRFVLLRFKQAALRNVWHKNKCRRVRCIFMFVLYMLRAIRLFKVRRVAIERVKHFLRYSRTYKDGFCALILRYYAAAQILQRSVRGYWLVTCGRVLAYTALWHSVEKEMDPAYFASVTAVPSSPVIGKSPNKKDKKKKAKKKTKKKLTTVKSMSSMIIVSDHIREELLWTELSQRRLRARRLLKVYRDQLQKALAFDKRQMEGVFHGTVRSTDVEYRAKKCVKPYVRIIPTREEMATLIETGRARMEELFAQENPADVDPVST
eukprot:Rmarinus@m.2298